MEQRKGLKMSYNKHGFRFRAWSKKEKRMISHDELNETGGFFYNGYIDSPEGWECGFELMLCTDLKDSKGNIIHDKDVLNVKYKDKGIINYRYLVVQDDLEDDVENKSRWLHRANKWDIYKMSKDCNIEIIGNIYENPELLNV